MSEPCGSPKAEPKGESNGAEERTRTFTPLRAPAPQAGASANSATSAWGLCHRTLYCAPNRPWPEGQVYGRPESAQTASPPGSCPFHDHVDRRRGVTRRS